MDDEDERLMVGVPTASMIGNEDSFNVLNGEGGKWVCK